MAYQAYKSETALILVLSGQTIQQAAAQMWGSYEAYHDEATKSEKAQLRRARAEYLAKTTPQPYQQVQAMLSVPLDTWLRELGNRPSPY